MPYSTRELTPQQQAADQCVALLISLLNIALKPQRKVISAEIANRLYTAMRDATAGGDPIYELLDDLLSTPPQLDTKVTQTLDYGDPNYARWRRQRQEDVR